MQKRFTTRVSSDEIETRDSFQVLDNHFLWNKHMLDSLFLIRDQQMSPQQKFELEVSGILVHLTCGFVGSDSFRYKGEDYNLYALSRVSCKRTGARFLARGIDDHGNVSNFVETEFILRNERFLLSFLQIRGSVPLFWEQNGSLLLVNSA